MEGEHLYEHDHGDMDAHGNYGGREGGRKGGKRGK